MTIIIIAHRLTTIQKCDRIVVFGKGKINGIGSVEQLEQKNSIFSKLVRSARQHRNKFCELKKLLAADKK